MNQRTILGSQIGRWIILAALAVVLAVLLMASGVRAQQDSTISYPEGGTDPVATFEATDPEGMPITWSLAENANIDGVETADIADGAGHFTLTDGVLRFSASPDFEAPSGEDATSNTYRVVALAADAATEGMSGYRKVIVNVTNVDEAGTLTWTVDPDGAGTLTAEAVNGGMPILQFQPGALLTASVRDGDRSGSGNDKIVPPATILWQWYRSSSKTSLGELIDGETAASYTVKDTAGNNDVGKYIHVKATYQVTGKAQESASLASDYPVQATKEQQNSLPEFDAATVTREVNESRSGGMAVGAPVTATDADRDVLNYMLSSGADQANFRIDQKTGQIKTAVALNYEQAEFTNDIDCGTDGECVVTVRATDSAGAATGGTGANDPDDVTVTITLKDVDEKPVFSSADSAIGRTAIMRNENLTALDGTPANVTYRATDPEGQLVALTLRGTDGALFGLDENEVLSFKTAPDFENPSDSNGDNLYQVTVRATAGSLYTDRMVWIRVNDVNEGPTVTGHSTISYAENGTDPVATFEATDPEGMAIYSWGVVADDASFPIDANFNTVTTDADDIVETDAADAEHFTLMDGVLRFSIGGTADAAPDFEAPRGTGEASETNTNTYKVVAQANDAVTGAVMGYRKVTVNVTNVDERGMVTWTIDPDGAGGLVVTEVNGNRPIMQFQPGALLSARVMDGDVVGTTKAVTNIQWQWYRSSNRTSLGTSIDGETNETYTVKDTAGNNDVGSYIHVQASYQVSTENSEIYKASLASDYPVQATKEQQNSLPEFDAATVTREVNESRSGGMVVGDPVTATDADGDVLNYALGEPANNNDNGIFRIDQKSGQITTSGALDYEETVTTEADQCTTANACVVTVTATDSAGADSTATVNIAIENVDEPPNFTDGDQAVFVDEGTEVVRADSDTANIYTAEDPEDQLVALTLMGADGDLFSLNADRALSFKTAPDFEDPSDANEDNLYEVTVRASDGSLNTDRMVRVRVDDADEAPEILQAGLFVSGPSSSSLPEKGTDAVGTYTATGPDAASARWSLEGDDRGDFMVEGSGASVMLKFRTSPDYEAPADADGDNVYEVTVKATDGTYTDTQNVMVTVTDDDDPGTVALSPTSPVVGTEVTAILSDDDSDVGGTTWQWASADAMDGTFTNIDGATSASYTPVEVDEDMYLRATATYDDVHGTGKSAMATSETAVVSMDSLGPVQTYDTDNTPGISPTELSVAISDYLSGELDPVELSEVIAAYING